MNSVDAVVIPSLCFENCPLVVCDALKLGKEVVSNSLGGVPELLMTYQNGNTAFLDMMKYVSDLTSIYVQAIQSR